MHWGNEYRVQDNVSAKAVLKRTERGISAELTLNTALSLPCSRCLQPTTLAILSNLRYLFLLHPPAEEDQDGEDFQEEEVVLLEPGTTVLQLAPYFWETFIVSLPPTVQCRDQCKGLCPQCGADMNIGACACRVGFSDPRLEILREAQVQDQENE